MATAAIFGSAFLLLTINFLTPKSINVSYATTSNCTLNPTLFPNITQPTSDNYHIYRAGEIKLGNFSVYANNTCVLAKKLTESRSSTAKVSLAGLPWPNQSVNIKSEAPPLLHASRPADKPISLTDTFNLELSSPDKSHAYKLLIDQKSAPCVVKERLVSCPLTGLGLKQASSYKLEVVRELGGVKSQPILSTTINTVAAVNISSTSIAPGALLMDKPEKIVLTTDKTLSQASGITLSANKAGTVTDLQFNYTVADTSIIITPASPLPRESAISLTIKDILASDSGYLEKPYSLTFTTSGGPKVISTGLGTYGQSTSQGAVLRFNTKLSKAQDMNQLISLSKGSAPVAVSLTTSDSSVSIKPVTTLERCTTYTITIASAIMNEYGVPSETPYSFSFRTICQEVFSIGTSNAGRSINAYKFGNGPSKILFIGATHGDELSSKYILDSWINELEANYTKIPTSKTIIVIPVINPDGVAAGTRVNGRDVDLNRNFPINNWKSDVIMPDKNLLVGGGGSSPLSEPESKALANYTTTLAPRLVLTYHSKGGMVVANEAGDSVTIAQNYGKSTRFWTTSESKLGTSFAYDTTGAYENWLAEKQSIPALLIELKSHTNNEFQTHKSAMWTVLNL